MLRYFGWVAVAGAAALLAFGAWVRLAPSDPAVWHVDPLSEPGTGKPNAYRVLPEGMGPVHADAASPVYPVDAATLAAEFDQYALSKPRTSRLAGQPDALWVTYVQRSRAFGFPDYVSVRFFDLPGGGATLAIYSRARFGTSDLGVNRERVEGWVDGLKPLARGTERG